MNVTDTLEVTVEHVTLAVGDSTGWHTHPGPLLVLVRRGVLTREDARGAVTTSGPGDVFLEPPDDVHCGRNDGAEPVELLVVYALPSGAPKAVPVAADDSPREGS